MEFTLRMCDEVSLQCYHYMPQVPGGSHRRIVIFIRSDDVEREKEFSRGLCDSGWEVVLQAVRGRCGSGGEFVPYRHELSDGVESLRWLSAREQFMGCQFVLCGRGYGAYCALAVLYGDSLGMVDGVILLGGDFDYGINDSCAMGVMSVQKLSQAYKWCSLPEPERRDICACWSWREWTSPMRKYPGVEKWFLNEMRLLSSGRCSRNDLPNVNWERGKKRELCLMLCVDVSRENGVWDFYWRMKEMGVENIKMYRNVSKDVEKGLVGGFLRENFGHDRMHASELDNYLISIHQSNDLTEAAAFRLWLSNHHLEEWSRHEIAEGECSFSYDFTRNEQIGQCNRLEYLAENGERILFVSEEISEELNVCGVPRLRICCRVNCRDSPIIGMLYVADDDGQLRVISRGAVHFNRVRRYVRGILEGEEEALDVIIRLTPVFQKIPFGKRLVLSISGKELSEYIPVPGGISSENGYANACLARKRIHVSVLHGGRFHSYLQLPLCVT